MCMCCNNNLLFATLKRFINDPQTFRHHMPNKCAKGMDGEYCAKDCTPSPVVKKRPRSSPMVHTPRREPKGLPSGRLHKRIFQGHVFCRSLLFPLKALDLMHKKSGPTLN